MVIALALAGTAHRAAAQDDLAGLSDEFGDAATLAQWSRQNVVSSGTPSR